ncbi:hypothetical protein J2W89_003928 [Pseudarthrobacter oxydans]|uniref:hypothetical protein n=1 Tax=Pseudarthrobacter oxydans TaxID=1671 RepID=UPI0028596A29|nr:hypothetical protein [Pseudarthrobacter oxydans]MDR6794746.1 hypothetical protein [Pseudarthrobacter oxydans]
MSERDNPAVLAYRVGQLEIAMKDAALAQRESTESHKEGVKELVTKMDTYALNFATKIDLEQAQRDADKVHAQYDKRLEAQDQEIEGLKGTIDGYPLVKKIVFTAAGVILLAVLGVIVNLAVKGQAS